MAESYTRAFSYFFSKPILRILLVSILVLVLTLPVALLIVSVTHIGIGVVDKITRSTGCIGYWCGILYGSATQTKKIVAVVGLGLLATLIISALVLLAEALISRL